MSPTRPPEVNSPLGLLLQRQETETSRLWRSRVPATLPSRHLATKVAKRRGLEAGGPLAPTQIIERGGPHHSRDTPAGAPGRARPASRSRPRDRHTRVVSRGKSLLVGGTHRTGRLSSQLSLAVVPNSTVVNTPVQSISRFPGHWFCGGSVSTTTTARLLTDAAPLASCAGSRMLSKPHGPCRPRSRCNRSDS